MFQVFVSLLSKFTFLEHAHVYYGAEVRKHETMVARFDLCGASDSHETVNKCKFGT
jgi:hypothetical protein